MGKYKQLSLFVRKIKSQQNNKTQMQTRKNIKCYFQRTNCNLKASPQKFSIQIMDFYCSFTARLGSLIWWMNCQPPTKLLQSIIERVEISLKVSINLNDEVQNTLQSSDHFLEPAFTAKFQKHCSSPTSFPSPPSSHKMQVYSLIYKSVTPQNHRTEIKFL